MRLHLAAWKNGLKSLYYLKSSSLLTNKKSGKTQVVTKDGCPWCTLLKETLNKEGIAYEEISKSDAQSQGLWKDEFKTVPQLWLYGRHIGGYTEYIKIKQPQTETTYAECTACEA
jgi:glutaredoxin